MPWHIEKREDKFCVIKDSDNSIEKCHGSESDAKDHLAALYASEDKETLWDYVANFISDSLPKEKPMKMQSGVKRPASAYACVPDKNKPSTWQLPLTDKNGKVTVSKLGQAAAALSSGGFRGNKVDLACSADSVKRRIRSEYRKLGVKLEDMPDSVKELESKEEMEDSNITFFKDTDGQWAWLLVVSNNRLDREKDILTSNGHRYFVEAIDSGKYKELIGHDMPELWIWHVNVPVGDAAIVHYDERGYLFAGGHGRKGKFYDKVFSALAAKEKADPGSLGASHGMPYQFIARDPVNQAYINEYLSKEFTILPKEEAANLGTWFPAVIKKESGMDIMPDHKRQWFIDTFGENTFNEFNQFLDTVAREADDAGIPKKELNSMTDSTEELKGKALEEAIEEVASDDTADTPVESVEVVEEEVKQEDSEEEMPEEEEEEEKEFITRQEMESLVKDMAVAIKDVSDHLGAITEQLTQLGAEVKELKESDEIKIAEKAASTPQASLSALFASYATSAIGSDAAEVSYHKERKLHQAGPEEAEDGPGSTGIPIVDGFIKDQRSGNRGFVFPGQPNGQQS